MLEPFLTSNLFAYLLIFCRIGSAVMVMPGIGEAFVAARIRLLFALALTALLMPGLASSMPPMPGWPGAVALAVVREIAVGVFFGMLSRVLISAAHTAGTLIALQSGLASAMMLDITQTSQSTPITNLLSMTALMLFFATNLHLLLIGGLADSYDIFPAAGVLPMGDFADYTVHLVGRVFSTSLQLAAPQIVVGLILNLGAGVLGRLMPGMQVFFVLMPPQILLSFFILMVTLSGTMLWYLHYMDEAIGSFIRAQPVP